MDTLPIAPPQIPGFQHVFRGGTSGLLCLSLQECSTIAYVESGFFLESLLYNTRRESKFEVDFVFKRSQESRAPRLVRTVHEAIRIPATALAHDNYLIGVYNNSWQCYGIIIPASLGPLPEPRIEDNGDEYIVTFIWT